MIGRRFSHYRILAKLGEGGMGTVYLAEDEQLGRQVALKFLGGRSRGRSTETARLLAEARAAAILDHAHICTIHEIAEAEGESFIVMAYIEGETLSDEIARGPLPLPRALNLARQISSALGAAHAAGIIHRDIKPSNIMIDAEGEAQILDFGLAHRDDVTRITRAGEIVGTLSCMSPEQCRGEEIDARVDLWALGVLFYEMLTGKLPFRGSHDQAMIYAILHNDPVPAAQLRPELPRAWTDILARTLNKDRELRYPDAGALLADLAALAGETVPAAGRGSRRVTRWLGWAGIGVMVALIVGWIFWPEEAVPFTKRDWVLITDFENSTGDTLFDRSLNTAMAVSIGQSRYVNILPRRRVREALRRMKAGEVAGIDAELGSEIAQREGLRVLIVPGISRAGGHYALTAVIEDASSGRALRSSIVRADDQDGLLGALDELSDRVRRHLGESLDEISGVDHPLVKVTTSSLPALKEYSLAIELHRNSDYLQARRFYEQALAMDSTFTSARASLGMLHFEASSWSEGFTREIGQAHLVRAVAEIDQLPDRERYSVLAFHARAVEGDLAKASGFGQALVEHYPDEPHAHNNLAQIHLQQGDIERAIAGYERSIWLDPSFVPPYSSLCYIFNFYTAQPESALAWCRRRLALEQEDSYLHDHMGTAYMSLDSLPQACAAFERSLALNPRSSHTLYRQSHSYRLAGRPLEAAASLERLLDLYPQHYWAQYYLGSLLQELGDEEAANHQFQACREAAAELNRTRETAVNHRIAAALAAARQGEEETAREELRAMPTGRGQDNRHYALARFHGILGDSDSAQAELALALDEDFTSFMWLKLDPDMIPLHGSSTYRSALERLRGRP